MRDRLAAFRLALGLTASQFEALIEIGVEQARAYASLRPTKENREARNAELSRAAERRLSAVLSPEQMEMLAATRSTASGVVNTVDWFAARGAAFTPEQLRQAMTLRSGTTAKGAFLRRELSLPEPTAPELTDAQRRALHLQRRWRDASALVDAVRSVRVEDPELKEP